MLLFTFFQTFLFSLFMFSGLGKLIDRGQFHNTLVALKFSAKMSRALSYLVPGIEIIVALLLLFHEVQLYGNMIILLLSFCFVWFGIRTIMDKRSIACNCFGDSITENIGWSTLFKAFIIIVIDLSSLRNISTINILNMGLMEILSTIFITACCILFYGLASLLIPRKTRLRSSMNYLD